MNQYNEFCNAASDCTEASEQPPDPTNCSLRIATQSRTFCNRMQDIEMGPRAVKLVINTRQYQNLDISL